MLWTIFPPVIASLLFLDNGQLTPITTVDTDFFSLNDLCALAGGTCDSTNPTCDYCAQTVGFGGNMPQEIPNCADVLMPPSFASCAFCLTETTQWLYGFVDSSDSTFSAVCALATFAFCLENGEDFSHTSSQCDQRDAGSPQTAVANDWREFSVPHPTLPSHRRHRRSRPRPSRLRIVQELAWIESGRSRRAKGRSTTGLFRAGVVMERRALLAATAAVRSRRSAARL